MNPLLLNKESFLKIKNHSVFIRFKSLKLTGIIIEVYLASNYPHEPVSFDFDMSSESKAEFEKANLEMQITFSVMEVDDIELK